MGSEVPKGRALRSAWYQLPSRTRRRLVIRLLAGQPDDDPALAPVLIGAARLNARLWWVPAAYMTILVFGFGAIALLNPTVTWTLGAVLLIWGLALAVGLYVRNRAQRCEHSSWEVLDQKEP